MKDLSDGYAHICLMSSYLLFYRSNPVPDNGLPHEDQQQANDVPVRAADPRWGDACCNQERSSTSQGQFSSKVHFSCAKSIAKNKKRPISISYNFYPTQFQAWSTPDKYSNYWSQKGSMRLSLYCQGPQGSKERHHFQTTNKHYYKASFYMLTKLFWFLGVYGTLPLGFFVRFEGNSILPKSLKLDFSPWNSIISPWNSIFRP